MCSTVIPNQYRDNSMKQIDTWFVSTIKSCFHCHINCVACVRVNEENDYKQAWLVITKRSFHTEGTHKHTHTHSLSLTHSHTHMHTHTHTHTHTQPQPHQTLQTLNSLFTECTLELPIITHTHTHTHTYQTLQTFNSLFTECTQELPTITHTHAHTHTHTHTYQILQTLNSLFTEWTQQWPTIHWAGPAWQQSCAPWDRRPAQWLDGHLAHVSVRSPLPRPSASGPTATVWKTLLLKHATGTGLSKISPTLPFSTKLFTKPLPISASGTCNRHTSQWDLLYLVLQHQVQQRQFAKLCHWNMQQAQD